MKDNKEYIIKKELKLRGFTEFSIKSFLKEPDKIVKDSYMKYYLYDLKRVIEVENSQEFKEWFFKNKNKRETLKQKKIEYNEKQKEINLDIVKDFKVNINILKEKILIDKAIEHYMARNEFSSVDTANKSFVDRICVNYLRHCCTSYERNLDKIFGKIGKNELYRIIKINTLNEIALKYPYLEEEVKNQLKRLDVL